MIWEKEIWASATIDIIESEMISGNIRANEKWSKEQFHLIPK